MSIFSTILLLMVAAYSVYLLWAVTKISFRQDENFSRIAIFEDKLVSDTNDYECFVIYDDAVWSKVDYIEARDKLIESPRFEFKYLLPLHNSGVFFSLAVNEESQIVYLALGSDSYDWNSAESPLAPQSGESISR